jgi:hypothetical protein
LRREHDERTIQRVSEAGFRFTTERSAK